MSLKSILGEFPLEWMHDSEALFYETNKWAIIPKFIWLLIRLPATIAAYYIHKLVWGEITVIGDRKATDNTSG